MYSEVKVNAKVSCHESACALDGLCVSRKKLKPTDHARNIVVIFNCNLIFGTQICGSAFHYIFFSI